MSKDTIPDEEFDSVPSAPASLRAVQPNINPEDAKAVMDELSDDDEIEAFASNIIFFFVFLKIFRKCQKWFPIHSNNKQILFSLYQNSGAQLGVQSDTDSEDEFDIHSEKE